MRQPNGVRRESLAIETLAVHAGREDFAGIGVHAPPLELSTTYPTVDLAEATASIDSMSRGGEPTGSFVYARFHNPTIARYEKALAAPSHHRRRRPTWRKRPAWNVEKAGVGDLPWQEFYE